MLKLRSVEEITVRRTTHFLITCVGVQQWGWERCFVLGFSILFSCLPCSVSGSVHSANVVACPQPNVSCTVSTGNVLLVR